MPSGSGLARVIKRRWRPLVGISLIGRRAGIAADYPDIGRLVGYGGCAGIRRREGRGKRQRRHCHAMTKQFVSHYPTYEGDSYTYVAYVLCARTSTHTHLYTHTYTPPQLPSPQPLYLLISSGCYADDYFEQLVIQERLHTLSDAYNTSFYR